MGDHRSSRTVVKIAGLLLAILVFQAVGSTSAVNLSHNPGASLFPAIAAAGQNIYVAWDDESFGATEILFERSTDSGQSFSLPLNLSNDAGDSRNVAITVSGNNVYVIWEDNTPGNFEIFYSVSRDQSQSFSPPRSLSQSSGDSILPKIVASEKNVYVVWQGVTGGNRKILYTRSTDSGETFSTPRIISQTQGNSRSPVIAVSSSDAIFVAWDDSAPGTHEIFFVESSDGGETFSVAQNISRSGTYATAPSLTASGSDVHLTWTERTSAGSYEVFYSWSHNGGASFTPPQNVSQSGTYSGASVIGMSGDSVSLAWIEGIRIAGNGEEKMNYELYYTHAVNSGGFFSPAENLSYSNGITVSPAIAVSGGNVYMVFASQISGNFEIFFEVLKAG